MSGEALTKDERDALLAKIHELEERMDESGIDEREYGRRKESFYEALGEYFDRLPRVVMSVCPFTGDPLKRSFDPYGLDGPWWHKDLLADIEEPRAPETFKVLLGALALGDREPEEATEEVIPGPEVPFVIPSLIGLPGMVAVVSRLEMTSGDVAYPIAYFSPEDIPQEDLHQPWLRQEFWYVDEEGEEGWTICNDVWDFELEPYLESGKLRWIQPGDEDFRLMDRESGVDCPYVGLEGERLPQSLEDGEREFLREHGCDTLQGFRCGRPVPAEEFSWRSDRRD